MAVTSLILVLECEHEVPKQAKFVGPLSLEVSFEPVRCGKCSPPTLQRVVAVRPREVK